MSDCQGTRHCRHESSRTCDRCGLTLCDGREGHWRGTYCLKGGAHRDGSGAAQLAPESKGVSLFPDVNVWVATLANTRDIQRPEDDAPRIARGAEKRAAILEMLRAGTRSADICRELHCSLGTVAAVRKANGITTKQPQRGARPGRKMRRSPEMIETVRRMWLDDVLARDIGAAIGRSACLVVRIAQDLGASGSSARAESEGRGMNPTIERHLLTMRQCACMFPCECPMCSALMRAVVVIAETEYADAVVRAQGRGIAGVCGGCGCTDETPCKRDGSECCWLDDTETLCSACAPDEEE